MKPIIHRDIIQYSDEWWTIREKRMTTSMAQAIASCGKGLETYISKIMAEYYSTAPKESKKNFSNNHTDRGLSLEEEAGTIYSFENNIKIEKIGFVTLGDYIGCSPDLFADEDGLTEIKCPSDEVYFKLLMTEKIDTKYIWQCQAQMMTCRKEWNDLTFYNPNFDEQFYIERIYPDEEKFDKLKEGFEVGEEMIKTIMNKMEG